MKHALFSAFAVACACAVLSATPEPAQAQPSRVFVAAQGSDANSCTFAAPCRTFQHAHDTVAAGGEIDVLDPAGYGALTISKSISIQGHGFAGVSAPSGNAITVNSRGGAVVNLRGLLIDGVGSGQSGIQFDDGASVHIQDNLIRSFTNGIEVNLLNAVLTVTNSTISDNSANGILMQATTSSTSIHHMRAVLDHVGLHSNGFAGLNLLGTSAANGAVTAIATDSVASYNGAAGGGGGYGFVAQSSGVPVLLKLQRCTVAYNSNEGILALGPGGAVYVHQSVIFYNLGGGWHSVSSGQLFSTGTNFLTNNAGDEDSQTPFALK